jgi:hypothetical protein
MRRLRAKSMTILAVPTRDRPMSAIPHTVDPARRPNVRQSIEDARNLPINWFICKRLCGRHDFLDAASAV